MENKEFFAALTDLVREKGISEEAFIETLENALASAYKKQFDGGADVTVSLDAEKGTIEYKATRYVVEEVEDKDKEISLEDAYSCPRISGASRRRRQSRSSCKNCTKRNATTRSPRSRIKRANSWKA